MIGIHNIKNCCASIAVAILMGISIKLIKKAILEFKGVQRRFNFIFENQNAIYYDDYAHHPTKYSNYLNLQKKSISQKK